MECSDIEDDELYDCGSEPEENEIKFFGSENSNNQLIDEENIQEFSESEFENILSLRKRRCTCMLSSSDENESILQDQQNEIDTDRTNQEKIQEYKYWKITTS
ncbi:hypothetical protein V1478_000217 [Vespula squamosa]|uniref:Uncharacterized protein n=1 Tax=Vespula squamosa TaxID=30214 RepID=A0ABD2C4W3_VESSQ